MKIFTVLAGFFIHTVIAHSYQGKVDSLQHDGPTLVARQIAYPTGPGYDVPALTAITALTASTFRSEPTVALPTAPVPGATPFPGAPPLPSVNIVPAEWPPLHKVPDTKSPQVQAWLKELDGHDIPNWSRTVNASCELSPAQATEAGPNARCWWTCGGCNRPTDITTCKDKLDWGLTFDDGPAFYTPKLLTFLDSRNLKATFYLIGSNVISRPATVQAEIMSGHELSVHTWSHAALTTLTNEQIVAELGWTREAIKQVTGVTPMTMRPPFGDIDDRVRAISLAMGMVPVMWTRLTPNNVEVLFDSNDWRVHAGQMNSTAAKAQLDAALNLAPTLDTGVIVLQHDLYQESVDLAVGYTIPQGLARSPAFNMKPVNTCQKQAVGESYFETTKKPKTRTPATSKPTGAPSTGPGGSGAMRGMSVTASVLISSVVVGAVLAV